MRGLGKNTFKVNVKRYDPCRQLNYSTVYEIEYGPEVKVLDLLEYVYRNYDNTLAFRKSCSLGKCGACAVVVNRKPVLACRERVLNLDLNIEPLAGFPIIKDLVVDRNAYQAFAYREFRRQDKILSQCIGCLCCSSACIVKLSSPGEFAGPASFVSLLRNYGFAQEVERSVLQSSGLSQCAGCKRCSANCPKNIDVFRLVIEPLKAVINSG